MTASIAPMARAGLININQRGELFASHREWQPLNTFDAVRFRISA
jgi:hypothetical protein